MLPTVSAAITATTSIPPPDEDDDMEEDIIRSASSSAETGPAPPVSSVLQRSGRGGREPLLPDAFSRSANKPSAVA